MLDEQPRNNIERPARREADEQACIPGKRLRARGFREPSESACKSGTR
jgi:hypothetical protein